ncbi:MAG TPA: DUF4395 domain-containing protein [Actinocrinis sp.]|nr:DUF4395 domain-containing protein [Actinocrinis sp.]
MIDPRGPRFAAMVTTVVLIAILLTRNGWLAVAQALVFAIGAGAGLRYAPYGTIYRTFIQKILPKPKELEHEAPPRFAQAVGFVFIAIAAIAFLAGATVVGVIATAFALAAAFLNAAFNYCLGCEMYLILRRATTR